MKTIMYCIILIPLFISLKTVGYWIFPLLIILTYQMISELRKYPAIFKQDHNHDEIKD